MSTIQIKRSITTAEPAASSLLPGELAYSEVSDKLFIGLDDGSIVSIGGQVDHDKLQTVESNANNFVLPEADLNTLGGVKKGDGVNIAAGVISFDPTSADMSGLVLDGGVF
ncbi:hypothetical protein [Kistimonas asteriae]|uniref:hypothetical protein n=1 Tax=Kistimonas asteriae TaxID=517724 RepID=UPI001BA70152|nr:hypothetical protein [Kistimonas asteriae]